MEGIRIATVPTAKITSSLGLGVRNTPLSNATYQIKVPDRMVSLILNVEGAEVLRLGDEDLQAGRRYRTSLTRGN